jgi:hypothetical protein
MNSLTRRNLLRRALAAGVGASAFEAFSTSPEAAVTSSRDLPPIDPTFVAGRVVEVGRGGSVRVLDHHSALHDVRFDGRTSIWREGEWGGTGLLNDDCIYAHGELEPDGALRVLKAWIDIDNFLATIVRITSKGAVLRPISGDEEEVAFGPSTRFHDFGGLSADVPRMIRPGVPVQVISFGKSPDRQTAHRVIPLATAGVSETPAEASGAAPLSTTSVDIFGVSSWECCGGHQGCGSSGRCAANGLGYCNNGADCFTDRTGMAYPVLPGKNSTCNPSCLPPGATKCCPVMPQLYCGFVGSITNVCTGQFAFVSIVDHGPCTRSIPAFGCNRYVCVKFDLTACTFTSIGGDLDTGLLDAHFTG